MRNRRKIKMINNYLTDAVFFFRCRKAVRNSKCALSKNAREH